MLIVGLLGSDCCHVDWLQSIFIYSLFSGTFLTPILSLSFISDERAVLLLLLNTFFYSFGHQHRNTKVKSHFITQEVRVITHYSFAQLTQTINSGLQIYKVLHRWRNYSIASINVKLNPSALSGNGGGNCNTEESWAKWKLPVKYLAAEERSSAVMRYPAQRHRSIPACVWGEIDLQFCRWSHCY